VTTHSSGKKKNNICVFGWCGGWRPRRAGGGGGGGGALDDSSSLDVVEIACVPDMLASLFSYWPG